MRPVQAVWTVTLLHRICMHNHNGRSNQVTNAWWNPNVYYQLLDNILHCPTSSGTQPAVNYTVINLFQYSFPQVNTHGTFHVIPLHPTFNSRFNYITPYSTNVTNKVFSRNDIIIFMTDLTKNRMLM